MKILAIGGEPATGKSHLVRDVLARLGPGATFKVGLLSGTNHGPVCVLGTGYFNGQPFPGTDRLSMAVVPQAEGFLRALSRSGQQKAVLFEGDRLVTRALLEKCATFADVKLWILAVPEQALKERHRSRGDTQTETFLRGRATKYRNLASLPFAESVPHGTLGEHSTAVERAVELLNN